MADDVSVKPEFLTFYNEATGESVTARAADIIHAERLIPCDLVGDFEIIIDPSSWAPE